ncbi:hypothetical protein BCV72DRAFT_246371 [Rhizopus microsporus var. microsporus]|uniref:Uncharacterized protein n=2 Tax=Rhizopus microsporus TaxID=58291 RepID=A0A2G4SGW9_RHIZD|nr:uncharacterized protein RHIMIDRAFT_248042 [Rhizopus microsporus ATCC 52813]ORE00848.1 hypothetical protein BCV72DRAFT_246371 [Rhizopus microsporus var. microsporus]PHZ08017.1 hypothetical protein RHIMIDRAFT_248042 [Rhizopus microsporus ATCC 52813]
MEENINTIMANVMRLASTVTQLQNSVNALTNETRAIQEAMNNNVSTKLLFFKHCKQYKNQKKQRYSKKKVSFNDRLAALIDRLYFEEQQQLLDEKFRKKTILQLQQLARDVYIEMKNDGFYGKLNWSDLSDDQRTYYTMRLEQLAKDKGWNIYRCIRLWAAKGLLSDRCRTRKQATKKNYDENENEDGNSDAYGDNN